MGTTIFPYALLTTSKLRVFVVDRSRTKTDLAKIPLNLFQV